MFYAPNLNSYFWSLVGGSWTLSSGATTERSLKRRPEQLGFPLVVVVLRGDDDHHGEDGAQHDGGDAHGQADEGEVAGLAGGYLRRHHVPPGYRRAHLSDKTTNKGTT